MNFRQLALTIFLHVSSGLLNESSIEIDGSGEEYLEKEAFQQSSYYRLERFLMNGYNNRVIPKRTPDDAVVVGFSVELYQIIEVNEPQQYMLLNAWLVERWKDHMLYWNPDKFDGLSDIILPKTDIWIPDTTLYNSLVMDDVDTRRVTNAKVSTLKNEKTALVELLYPTLYKFTCNLDLRFFPFDIQSCKMTFGSWTYDNKGIDYFAHNASGQPAIGTSHCIENEGWNILGTKVIRREVKYQCCVNKYTLLEFYLHIQRKPLFYLINLIAPTSVITLIAIIGFFSSSTVHDTREEKITLGITTLLSMSILIFMVSDQMPSTSSFIPLIGWFYTSMMMLISTGTLAASLVIYIQKKGIIGQRPSPNVMSIARRVGKLIRMEMPLLMKQAYALKAKQDKIKKQNDDRKNDRRLSVWQRWQILSKDLMRGSISPSRNARPTSFPMRSSLATPSIQPSDTPNVTFGGTIFKKNRKLDFNAPTELTTLSSSETQEFQFIDEDVETVVSDDDKSWVDGNSNGGFNWGRVNGGFMPSRSQTTSLASMNAIRNLSRNPSRTTADLYGIDPNVPLTQTVQQRNLAEIEYDWLAAVIERCFLMLFLVLFFLMCFGINGIGMYYWHYATVDA
uniref:Uncharacterized protein n=1 Tax=Acrobeloides nanus TaxID=290746 RepID=A0A914DZY8_9BILA